MSKVLSESKLTHWYRGEDLNRPVRLVLEELDANDESGMKYEMRVEHPKTSKTSRGQDSPQSPEVFRFQDLETAQHHYEVYSEILDVQKPEEPPR